MALTTGGRLSASGKYLASFVEHYETDDCDFRRVLTLRKLSDGCSSSVATIVDQILDRDTLLPDAVNNVAKIYLDDAYVIVEYRRNRRLDIRSTELFGVLLHTLSLVDSILVDYSGGYFMSRIRGSPDGVKYFIVNFVIKCHNYHLLMLLLCMFPNAGSGMRNRVIALPPSPLPLPIYPLPISPNISLGNFVVSSLLTIASSYS